MINKLLCLLGASVLSCSAAPTLPAHGNLFSHFWGIAETLNCIEKKAFRTPALNTVIEEGLKAMVNKIDAHSAFFSPKSYQNTVEMSAGRFPGIGVSVMSKQTDADSLIIVDAICGGPADLAGIKSGDAIIKVDGVKVRGITTEEVVAKLKGPLESTVSVTIVRDKKPLKFKLVRQLIQDRSAYAYALSSNTSMYIALKSFSEQTPHHFKSFLSTALEKKCTSIIIDMRKNPGGVIDSAVKTASLLLPDQSEVARTQNNKKEILSRYYTNGTPLYDGSIPLFVLTDNFTASAAEILTGCLQHHARIHSIPLFVIGMPTFGKGSVQEIIPLQNGCAIKLTTMLYALPNGECIQALGIIPDIIVKPKAVPAHELKWIEDLYGKEVALTGHITRAEVTGTAPETTTPTPPDEDKEPASIEKEFIKALQADSVVQTALTLANVWHLGHKKNAPRQSHDEMVSFLKKMVITDSFDATPVATH